MTMKSIPTLKKAHDCAETPGVTRRFRLVGMSLLVASLAAASTATAQEAPPPYEPAQRMALLDDRTPPGSNPTTPSNPNPNPNPNPSPDPDRNDSRAGHLDLLLHAKSTFDQYTRPTDAATWTQMRATYDAMVVYTPYFDERVSRFDREFAYENLYGMQTDQSRDGRAQEHPEWILRTAAGDPVYVPFDCGGSGGCPQYAADIGHPGFQADLLAMIRRLSDGGYHGLMIDDVNLLRRFSDRQGNGLWPINPRTGENMTLGEWRAMVASLLERIRAEFPDLKIMHNSIWYSDSPAFDNRNVDRQISAADYIMLERGATDRGLTGGNGTYSYARFIQFIDRVHQLGANVLLLDETATNDTQQMFNLATALLVNDGRDLVSTEDPARIAPNSVWSGFSIDLGGARGPYQRNGPIWRRDFDDGIVVTHEPGGGDVTVALGGSFRNGAGQVVSEIVLGPREAAVLYRV